MTHQELKDRILKDFPEVEFMESKQALNAVIPNEKLHSFASYLKQTPELNFDYLYCLTGVDLKEDMMVVYHLQSTFYGHSIVVKTKTNGRENPNVDTVCGIWRTAEFHEREAFDLLGIIFNNHPDLRRILMDENWIGFPLRKDYVDEINIIERD